MKRHIRKEATRRGGKKCVACSVSDGGGSAGGRLSRNDVGIISSENGFILI